MTNQSVWKTRFLIRPTTVTTPSATSPLRLRYRHGNMETIKSVVRNTLVGNHLKEDKPPCNSNLHGTNIWKKCWKVCPSPPKSTNSTFSSNPGSNKCAVILTRCQVALCTSNTHRWCSPITTRCKVIISGGSKFTLANQIPCNNYPQTLATIYLTTQMPNIKAFPKSTVFHQPNP